MLVCALSVNTAMYIMERERGFLCRDDSAGLRPGWVATFGLIGKGRRKSAGGCGWLVGDVFLTTRTTIVPCNVPWDNFYRASKSRAFVQPRRETCFRELPFVVGTTSPVRYVPRNTPPCSYLEYAYNDDDVVL